MTRGNTITLVLSAAETDRTPSKRTRASWGRRVFLVDRAFQLKYSILFGCAGTLTTAFAIGLMHWFRRSLLAQMRIPETILSELRASDLRAIWPLMAVAIGAGLVLALVGVWATHRIAGPVYVMTQSVATLARGRYPSIRPIRKGDDLRDLVELFQKSVESLRARDVEETFKIEQAILRLMPYEKEEGVREALASLRALRNSKSGVTGHLQASVQYEAPLTPPSSQGMSATPLHVVRKGNLGS